jgi:hypothetical protein
LASEKKERKEKEIGSTRPFSLFFVGRVAIQFLAWAPELWVDQD